MKSKAMNFCNYSSPQRSIRENKSKLKILKNQYKQEFATRIEVPCSTWGKNKFNSRHVKKKPNFIYGNEISFYQNTNILTHFSIHFDKFKKKNNNFSTKTLKKKKFQQINFEKFFNKKFLFTTTPTIKSETTDKSTMIFRSP